MICGIQINTSKYHFSYNDLLRVNLFRSQIHADLFRTVDRIRQVKNKLHAFFAMKRHSL